jgi:cytoskeletal protein CcmA (bactofilin family)
MRTGTAIIIKGELTADEDLTIDGLFEGTIDLQGHHLVAAAASRVRASVTAGAVTLDGHLEGHITADSVDIGPTATVEANVIARHFAIEEGAHFKGSVNTERARASGSIAKHRQRLAGVDLPTA